MTATLISKVVKSFNELGLDHQHIKSPDQMCKICLYDIAVHRYNSFWKCLNAFSEVRAREHARESKNHAEMPRSRNDEISKEKSRRGGTL